MCFSSSPNVTPLPAPAPQQVNAATAQADEAKKVRQRAAASNTLLTGETGAALPKMQTKSLLGA
jgi:hypothetical protein